MKRRTEMYKIGYEYLMEITHKTKFQVFGKTNKIKLWQICVRKREPEETMLQMKTG